MPQRANDGEPAVELVEEKVDASLVDFSRDGVTIRDPWEDPASAVADQHRGLMRKLAQKIFDGLRRLAQ